MTRADWLDDDSVRDIPSDDSIASMIKPCVACGRYTDGFNETFGVSLCSNKQCLIDFVDLLEENSDTTRESDWESDGGHVW